MMMIIMLHPHTTVSAANICARTTRPFLSFLNINHLTKPHLRIIFVYFRSIQILITNKNSSNKFKSENNLLIAATSSSIIIIITTQTKLPTTIEQAREYAPLPIRRRHHRRNTTTTATNNKSFLSNQPTN
jgi:hypothetical protein